MKRIILLLFTVHCSLLTLLSQAPQKFNYQAVVRDDADNLVKDQNISIKISILQGAVDGTVVYSETHSPTSNSYGLVTLEIGGGTIISGNLSTIDWGSSTYFIKVELDATGGTTYTEMGTNQILSVPYALHAKAAETIVGTIPETDPIYTASQAANITASDITNLSNLSGTNTGDQDLSTLATKTALTDSIAQVRSEIPNVSGFLTNETDPIYTASQAANITASDITNLSNLSGTNTGDQDLSNIALKTNVLELENTTPFTPDADYEPATKKYVDDNAIVTSYSIGDFAQGGIVFWVDETGQHGLVCAKTDQSTGVRWYAGTYGDTQAKGDGPFAGEANTAIIIATHVAIGSDLEPYAARMCNELQITEAGKTYSDWYLPSKEEVNLMYQNRSTIDATALANSGSSFVDNYYWSSTEYSNFKAWAHYFTNGNPYDFSKVNSGRVRAIRAF